MGTGASQQANCSSYSISKELGGGTRWHLVLGHLRQYQDSALSDFTKKLIINGQVYNCPFMIFILIAKANYK